MIETEVDIVDRNYSSKHSVPRYIRTEYTSEIYWKKLPKQNEMHFFIFHSVLHKMRPNFALERIIHDTIQGNNKGIEKSHIDSAKRRHNESSIPITQAQILR